MDETPTAALTCQESWHLFVWATVCLILATPSYLAGIFGVGWPAQVWTYTLAVLGMYLAFRGVCAECRAETLVAQGQPVFAPEISRAAFFTTVKRDIITVGLLALSACTLPNASGPIDFAAVLAVPSVGSAEPTAVPPLSKVA